VTQAAELTGKLRRAEQRAAAARTSRHQQDRKRKRSNPVSPSDSPASQQPASKHQGLASRGRCLEPNAASLAKKQRQQRQQRQLVHVDQSDDDEQIISQEL
jgi:hypothetical protein